MTQENTLGRYTILRELGRGAIGTVCAARDQVTGATVALKSLDPALLGAGDAKLAGLFLKNARSAARLAHQNIVKVHDTGEAGGTAYVAMELVEGESLRRLLNGRPLPIARALQIFDDIASALAYAHEEGMAHRGVRPSSIFVLRSGIAKIGDFGLGQIGKAALPYMSPEQARGNTVEHAVEHRVDHRCDLFSLGAVFYEMLTGRPPFTGGSPKEIKESILRAKPPKPSEVNPHVPAALDALVCGLLAPRPDDRPANARLVLRDLQRIKEALGLRPGANVVAADPAPSVPPGPREPTLGIPEPQLKTPEPQLRPEPQIRPEPQMRTPEPPRFRDRAPMHDAPEPAWHDPGLNVGGPRFHEARPMNYRDPRPMSYRARVREPRSASRTPVLATLALLLAVLSIGLTVFLNSPDLGERLLASLNPQAPARYVAPPSLTTPPPPAASSSSTTPPLATQAIEHPSIAPPAPPLPPAADDAKPEEAPTIASAPDSSAAKPPAQAPNPPAQPRTLPPPEPAQTAKAITAPPREAPQAKPTANVAESQPGGTAKLTIAVAPRGEIYIDGQHKGTTPPITTLDLEPGLHRIEIRHGSRRPYLTYINVQSGDQRRIRYDFDARGHPPA